MIPIKRAIKRNHHIKKHRETHPYQFQYYPLRKYRDSTKPRLPYVEEYTPQSTNLLPFNSEIRTQKIKLIVLRKTYHQISDVNNRPTPLKIHNEKRTKISYLLH